MKLSIVGYGNLGKSLEKEIQNANGAELTAIYSRRHLDNPLYRPLKEVENDCESEAMLSALGSYNDVRAYSHLLAKFDTVDSFDTHGEIENYKRELNALNNKRLALVGLGWDPGLLSVIRGAVSLGREVTTVWGQGISQGHSNAVRSIAGVIDAVQFTLPKQNCEKLIEQGEQDVKKLHERVCYVACVEEDKAETERKIKSMPNYFEGYDVTVKFVSPKEIRELKNNTAHCGQVFCIGEGYKAYAKLSLENNTALTAKIMLRYALAIPQMKKDGYLGAMDALDIPLKYIAGKELA